MTSKQPVINNLIRLSSPLNISSQWDANPLASDATKARLWDSHEDYTNNKDAYQEAAFNEAFYDKGLDVNFGKTSEELEEAKKNRDQRPIFR